MSNVTSIMTQIKAENLLEGSDILVQIADLRRSVQIASDGDKLNFDDYFAYLQQEGTKIPRLELLKTVPPRQEGNYQVQLIEALDQVQEAIAFVYNKIISFQARLIEVDAAMKTAASTFEAWYLLALDEHLSTTELKLPQTARKGLATSEFNRLMGGAPIAVLTLQVAVKAEIAHLDAKKKMAREKCDRGRDQINASFMSQLPGNSGISAAPGSLRILQEEPAEEEDESVPVFISKRQPVAPESSFVRLGTTANGSHTVFVAPVTTVDTTKLAEAGILVPARTLDEPAVEAAKGSDILPDIEEDKPSVTGARAEDKAPTTSAKEPATEAAVEAQPFTPERAEEMTVAHAGAISKALDTVATYTIGVDLASGSDITVAAIITRDEVGEIVGIEPVDPASVEELEETAPAAPQTGFYKTGTPAGATVITPAEVIARFAHDDADDDNELKESIAEAVDSEEDRDVIDATFAENTASNPRTEVSPTPKPSTAFEEFPDDELADLLPKSKPSVAAPTPEPQPEHKPESKPSTPAPVRKKLSFNYDEE